MSKKWKEKQRINAIIERESTKFPGVNPDHVRKIWLDGFAEGKQDKVKYSLASTKLSVGTNK